MRKNVKGFSIIEILVVIVIIALLIGILIPALSSARRSSRMMTSNTQMRGVIQDFLVYAQDNNGWYPGIDGNTGKYVINMFNFNTFFQNKPFGISLSNFNINQVELAICLNEGLFGPKYPISPGETNTNVTAAKSPKTGEQTILNKNGPNSSYAMLRVDNRGGLTDRDAGRLAECNSNMTSDAVIFSDRGMKHKSSDSHEYLQTTSIWSKNTKTATSHPEQWIGGVAWGDGHVNTHKSAVMNTTSYAKTVNHNDNIFVVSDGADSKSNAYMISGGFKNILSIITP